MTTIIAGNFEQKDEAENAASDLAGSGFAPENISTFFVNPPGQHDLYPIGGDEAESPGTKESPHGSVSAAAVGGAIGAAVGLAAVALIGPAGPVAGAGVGAYTGSLYGALAKTDDKTKPEADATPLEVRNAEHSRKSGMVVAVSAPAAGQQNIAVRVLRANGASDIEHSDGTIVGGEWTDFDPLAPLKLVAN